MIGTHLLLTGVTNLLPVALTWPKFFTTPSTSTPPYTLHHEAVDPYLQRHPYAVQSLGLLPTIIRIPLLTLHNLTAATIHTPSIYNRPFFEPYHCSITITILPSFLLLTNSIIPYNDQSQRLTSSPQTHKLKVYIHTYPFFFKMAEC